MVIDTTFDFRSDEFGVHRTSVVRALRAGGVYVRYRILTDDDLDEARVLHEGGLSLSGVGERFGLAARTVSSRCRRPGIPTRAVGTKQSSAGDRRT